MSLIAPGTCRHCGCHGDSCTLQDGDKCIWANRERTLCNAPGCLAAERERLERNKLDRAVRRADALRIWRASPGPSSHPLANTCHCIGRRHHSDCKYFVPRNKRRKRRAA